MASTALKKVSVTVKLDNGTDSQGNQKTVSISIGAVSKDTMDNDKALAIVGALEPCISKMPVSVERTDVSTLSAA